MTSDAKSMAAASIERNCKWNPIEDDSGRRCSAELSSEDDICVNCAAVRERWLTRLIAEVYSISRTAVALLRHRLLQVLCGIQTISKRVLLTKAFMMLTEDALRSSLANVPSERTHFRSHHHVDEISSPVSPAGWRQTTKIDHPRNPGQS